MTVSSNASKAGPYAGSGTTGPFSFGFTTFSKNDISVIRADASGAEATLVVDSDYTVSLNSDQVASPGGTITLMSALATGYTLAILGSVANAQTTQLPNGGAYNATTVERAIDRTVQMIKQLGEQVSRAVKVTVTSGTSPDTLISSINTAASSANAAWNAFQGQYYGASATNPTTDPLGNAMTAGDLYWNTAVPEMRVYSGSAWGAVTASVSTPTQLFSGTGAQTAFTLSGAPASIGALEVFISGVRQLPTTDYTLSGTTLTFLSAPPAGTNNIFVRWITTQAIGVPSDGTVTLAKLDATTYGNSGASKIFQLDATGVLPVAQGAFTNLQMSATGLSANVSVSYDSLLLSNGSNGFMYDGAASATINTASTGAGGLDTGTLATSSWYSVWRIAKADGTKSWLISLSATAPTMPTGYTFKARIGWVRTDSSGNKYPLAFKQSGRTAQYVLGASGNMTALPAMATGTTSTAWAAVGVTSFIPSTASRINAVLNNTNAAQFSACAPNSNYTTVYNGTLVAPLVVYGGAAYWTQSSWIALESANIYWICPGSTGYLYCLGWEDNL